MDQLRSLRKSTSRNYDSVIESDANYFNSLVNPYPYVEYKSLGDALAAVCHAHEYHEAFYPNPNQPKVHLVTGPRISKAVSHTRSSVPFRKKNFPPKQRKDFEQLYPVSGNSDIDNPGERELSTASKTSLHPNVGSVRSDQRSYITMSSLKNSSSSSSELLLTNDESVTSYPNTVIERNYGEHSSIMKKPRALKSVIVQDLPIDFYNLTASNNIQVLQEKIIVATSLHEYISAPGTPESRGSKAGTRINKSNPAIQQKTLDGMSRLLDLLNEPFIPDGYELSGKHLEHASSAINSLQDLLQTDLFKNIERFPEGQRAPHNRVTWAPGLLDKMKSTVIRRDSSISSFVPVSKHGIHAAEVEKYPLLPSKMTMANLKKPKGKGSQKFKGIPKKSDTTKSSNTLAAEREKLDAEKGLFGIEIDEFDPSSCFFYRDEHGNYNSHKYHFRSFNDDMNNMKKSWKK